MKSIIATTAFLLAELSVAQSNTTVYGGSNTFGAGGGSSLNDTEFTDANREPNATRSVDFNIDGQTWTLRVNVTDISVPDAVTPDTDADPYVVNTVFDLQWPNKTATLNETVEALSQGTASGAQTAQPLCISVLTTPVWPNVTNRYQDSDDGSCSNALGAACTRAILNGYEPPVDGQCATSKAWSILPECGDVFGPSSLFEVATGSISGGDSTSPGYATAQGGDFLGRATMFSISGTASPANDITSLQAAESQLRIMVLKGPGIDQLLCMRVDASIDDSTVSALRSAVDGASATQNGSPTKTGTASSKTSTGAAGNLVAVTSTVGLMGYSILLGLL